MEADKPLETGLVSGPVTIARRSPAESLRYLVEIARDLEETLRRDGPNPTTGVKITPKEAQQRLAGLMLGMEVLADRLSDDESLRPMASEALKVLTPVQRTGMEDRCIRAVHILRKALDL